MARRTLDLPVDAEMIKFFRKERGFTYKDIEYQSNGRITEDDLKQFMSRGKKANENMLLILADVLKCDKLDLVDKGYLLSSNLSFETNRMIGELYCRNKEDVNRFYARKIREFHDEVDLKTMLNQSHRLFLLLSSGDLLIDKSLFSRAFDVIGNDFAEYNCIGNMEITKIQDNEARNLLSKIAGASGDYSPQQVMLMFLYVLILFDAIFLVEAIASATQLVPERRTEKADQYFELTYRNEKMRNVLIDAVLYKGMQLDGPNILECGIDDQIIESIVLMLAACEKCHQHINGNYVDSEYVNRKTFAAILSMLERTFDTLNIELPKNDVLTEFVDMNTKRFGHYYNKLKAFFNALNPPRKRYDKEQESFFKGFCFAKIKW